MENTEKENPKGIELLINTADSKTQLEKIVDDIHEDLKNDLERFLEDVLDIQLIISYPQKELRGFDMAVAIGNPNIYVVYESGICQIRGYWGSNEDIKPINPDICEEIMEYLS